MISSQILPPGTKASTCVIRNECEEHFTFQIAGNESFYIGKGDFHNSRFDYLSKMYDISEVQRWNPFVSRQGAADLNRDYCRYNIIVYPSDDLYSQYVTVKPAVYTGLVAFVLLCIFLVAITYDCVVQRRLKKSLASAMESRALVSSLFPDNVQGRLFEDDDGGINNGEANYNKK